MRALIVMVIALAAWDIYQYKHTDPHKFCPNFELALEDIAVPVHGDYGYVSESNARRLLKFPKSGKGAVKIVPIDGQPHAIGLAPNGEHVYVYVQTQSGPMIYVFNTGTDLLERKFTVSQVSMTRLTVANDEKFLIMVSNLRSELLKIDAVTGNILASAESNHPLVPFAMSFTNDRIYLAERDRIRQIDIGTGLNETVYPFEVDIGDFTSSSDGKLLAVRVLGDKPGFKLLNTESRSVTAMDFGDGRPVSIAFGLKDSKLYTANSRKLVNLPEGGRAPDPKQEAGSISVIDINRGESVKTIKVSGFPQKMTVSGATLFAIVVPTEGAASIAMIDTVSDTLSQSLPLPAVPQTLTTRISSWLRKLMRNPDVAC